jgi:predicted Zn-dependent peptidase
MLAESTNVAESKSPAKLRQSLLAAAFDDLPYRNPQLGWPGDVTNLRLAEAKAFLDTYFVPSNMVISIVGDVDPSNAQHLAERYFGPIPAKPRPPAMHMQEVPQFGPKTVVLWGATQPLLMIGYKRPAETNRDDAALDVIRMILGDSRTGWMQKDLVEEKRIAQSAEAFASFPAARYVNLFVLSITPARDGTVEENRKAVDDLVTRLQSKPVDAETLARVKNVLRGRFARLLGSNRRLAALLPYYYVNFGDWARLFTAVGEYDRLTAAEVQRVALKYLTPSGRTVAYITTGPESAGGVQ